MAGTQIGRWLHAEGCAWRAAFCVRSFYALLALLLLALLLAPQLPLRYVIDVGKEEGYGSDLPHLQGFNTAERDIHGSFRWTRDGATVTLPGLGRRPLLVEFTFFPVSAQVAAGKPENTCDPAPGAERWCLAEPGVGVPAMQEAASGQRNLAGSHRCRVAGHAPRRQGGCV